MASVARRIVIIGGGFSGMSAAIELRKRGAEVDLVELDPGWRNYGAGISLGGATLRAFRQLGILQRVPRAGQRDRQRRTSTAARAGRCHTANAAYRRP